MSLYCEEFGCLPYPGGLSDQPWGVLTEIRLLRQYVRAREDVDRERTIEKYDAAPWAKRWCLEVGAEIQRLESESDQSAVRVPAV